MNQTRAQESEWSTIHLEQQRSDEFDEPVSLPPQESLAQNVDQEVDKAEDQHETDDSQNDAPLSYPPEEYQPDASNEEVPEPEIINQIETPQLGQEQPQPQQTQPVSAPQRLESVRLRQPIPMKKIEKRPIVQRPTTTSDSARGPTTALTGSSHSNSTDNVKEDLIDYQNSNSVEASDSFNSESSCPTTNVVNEQDDYEGYL